MVKIIHLSVEDMNLKINKLQGEIKSSELSQNKTKRKRLYQQLAKLRKALSDPQNLTINPQLQQQRLKQDKQKRIFKKLQKKKQILQDVKKQKRYQKRCLNCGARDHLLAECNLGQTQGSGYCFKCGSTQHNHKQCNMNGYQKAICFYCGKKGHIARQCENNEKGLYIKGGSCFGCGSVRHTLKQCPVRHKGATFSNKQQF